jgi:hypothetical protein
MPTEVLAFRASADGRLSADEQRFWGNVTKTFADGRRRFELGGPALDAYLDKNKDLLAGVRDRGKLVRNLQATQRLFSLTTRHDELGVLRAAGLDSSARITRVGRDVFLTRYGTKLGADRSELIFNKAEHIASTAMAVLAEISPQYNSVPLAAMAGPDVKQVPSLANLVGSLDLCACKECRAIGGPASYYAEILGFLRDRELQPAPPTGETTALEVLLGRRPDLGELELTCENTNTVLPYIDLVNEILESVIAPFVPFSLPNARRTELDARTISPALRTAFATHDAPLTDEHVAYVVQPGEQWFVTDHSVLYAIERSSPANLRVKSATYQTGAPTEQLAANPEHMRPEAYERLREAVFPWELPLDLWREEVVRYLDHLGADRHELMVELSAEGPWAAPSRLDVSQEHLGLSDRERQIITKSLPPGTAKPWDFYGLAQTGNQVEVFDPANPDVPSAQSLTWLEALAWIEVLLNRSQLQYEELVELLTTAFVNPSGAVRIASADPADLATCDLYKLQLTGANGAFFDRLHRFVRLRRRLRWSAQEPQQPT